MRPFIQFLYPTLFALTAIAAGAQATATAPLLHQPQYAQNFTITQYPTHKLLSISGVLSHSKQPLHYVLVPKGSALPEIPAGAILVRTPVERVVILETVYIGYLQAIDKLSAIVGAGTVDFISNPEVRERIRSKAIQSVQVGQELDIERLLLLQPDLILTSISGDPNFDIPSKILRSDLPVVLTAGYMEAHPLARAEWIKFIAAFFDADAVADSTFQETADRYQALRRTTIDRVSRPTVFCGATYSGAWYVPGGESYMARAINDAGGEYLWADHPQQGAIPLDTERVFLKAAHADIWLDPSHYRSLDELFAANSRFRKFRAAQQGSVYNNTKQVGLKGGNAIWERGIVHPDQVLEDLIQIFHPENNSPRDFNFYQRLK
ncbi:MAG: iron complex transport system substrate-binding protein [Lentimonas sp.]|jgi:iron complex transport system substrate-binding protein